ncbi:hypothetical protein [Noviherbaspirillum sp. UKPF54]|uniref:hypothetical protein n=1 Tax=Noviherbaspirillum sp. UKPF54 TaxID=2601898 RepID=UPI0011B0F6CD|nr:hypothetical protein [Noviherbaspirillum sp. UKPF54]QDZ27152.1 hypothetical protein FAY22_03795 [Noviherbaspirillum sp. UKPF54]
MKTRTSAVLAVAAMLLAGCAAQEAGQSSGDSGTSGSVASGGDGMLNRDVSDAVSRGSTQGFSPHSPLSPSQ